MNKPYEELGVALKAFRVAAKKSVEDAAGAVEIKPDELARIEAGEEMPSEDILELLISHFSLREQEAIRLWELAGFETDDFSAIIDMSDDDNQSKNDPKKLNVNIPADTHVLYSDMVHVMSNKYGVVMNFIQGVGPDGQPTVVSRVGMSREHAQSVIEVLKRSLEQQESAEK